jgi:acetyl esterase/lipase
LGVNWRLQTHRILTVTARLVFPTSSRYASDMNARPLFQLAHLCLLLVSPLLLCWAHAEEARVRLPPGAKAHRDLAYVTNGHERQKLDLYVPAKSTGPLLVVIHGGGWTQGSKDKAEGLPMLAQGYAVANINYRLSQHAIFPAQIEDCKSAVRWLRARAKEYGYDPNRIGAWGGSAGGHLVAMLATTGHVKDFDVGENLDQSSAIQCGVDVFGPADLVDWTPPSSLPIIQATGPESVLVKLLGGTAAEKPELAKRASPVTWVTKDCAPLYIMHGTVDQLVGLEQSQKLEAKMKSAGVEVTLDVVQGAGHGGAQFLLEGRAQKLLDFLNRHLMPK